MEIAGFSLALIGFLLAAGVWIRSMKFAEEAAAEKERLTEKLDKTKAKVSEVSEKVRVLESDLAEAVARRDEKAIAAAMWELELERSYRQWHDVIVPSNRSRVSGGVTAGQLLSFAISQDVDRLREEVGVSIRFEGSLDLEIEPETALGALRISEELLALAAKRADEVKVSLCEQSGPLVGFGLSCLGWNDDDSPSETELARTIEKMAHRLNGSIEWNITDEAVDVEVTLPAVKSTDEVVIPDDVVENAATS